MYKMKMSQKKVNLKKGDTVLVLDKAPYLEGEILRVRRITPELGLIDVACYAFYRDELAKRIADTKIARKLYNSRIVKEMDGIIFIRLEKM